MRVLESLSLFLGRERFLFCLNIEDKLWIVVGLLRWVSFKDFFLILGIIKGKY